MKATQSNRDGGFKEVKKSDFNLIILRFVKLLFYLNMVIWGLLVINKISLKVDQITASLMCLKPT